LRFFLIAVIPKDKERLAVAMAVCEIFYHCVLGTFLFSLSSETDAASWICDFQVFKSEVTRFFPTLSFASAMEFGYD